MTFGFLLQTQSPCSTPSEHVQILFEPAFTSITKVLQSLLSEKGGLKRSFVNVFGSRKLLGGSRLHESAQTLGLFRFILLLELQCACSPTIASVNTKRSTCLINHLNLALFCSSYLSRTSQLLIGDLLLSADDGSPKNWVPTTPPTTKPPLNRSNLADANSAVGPHCSG